MKKQLVHGGIPWLFQYNRVGILSELRIFGFTVWSSIYEAPAPNDWEVACREFLRGCTDAEPPEQEACAPCLAGLISRLKQLERQGR